MDFALFALDHAADSVIPKGGPLVPFCLIEVAGDRHLSRFPGDLEAGQAAARDRVRSSPEATLAAVAWDGYLTVEGQRTDAVFVEASEGGASDSVVLAQRYRKQGRFSKSVERLGNAALVARGRPLF